MHIHAEYIICVNLVYEDIDSIACQFPSLLYQQ